MVNRVGRAKKRIEYKRKLKERRKMLVSLQFNPTFLERNEKLQTVYEIESFTGMAHDDAKVLFVSACVKNYIVTLTKNVTKEEFIQMDKDPTNCITINEVDVVKESSKRNENYEKLLEKKDETIDKLKKKLKQIDSNSTEPVDTEVKHLTTTLFGKPIVLLPNSEYNQMIVKLKECDKLKDASNRAEILYENTIKKYKEQIEALQKYEHRYKDLRGSLENTLTQFK